MKNLAKYFSLSIPLVILSFHFSFAQQNKIDSLLSLLKKDKEDTTKVNTLNALAIELIKTGDYANGLTYSNDGFELAAKLNFKKGMAKAKNNIGIIYYYLGNYPEALKEHFFALKIREETGDKYGIAASHGNIGLIYYRQGNYPEALKEHFFALKIKEETGDKKGIADSHSNIGVIYMEQGNYPEALKEYFSSLKIREEIGDKQGIANCHNNIGNIYDEQGNYPDALKEYFFSLKILEEIGDKYGIASSHNNIGNIYYEQGSYPEALKEHFSSLKIREEIGDKQGIAGSHNNIGLIYHMQGNYPEALKEYFSSLKIKEEIGDKDRIAASHINIGHVYIKQNKAKEGKKEFETALRISREIGSKDVIKDSYSGLSEADSALGNYKAAYQNYKMYIIYRDSIINEENTKKSVQSQMQFEFDKKEAVANAEHKKELENQQAIADEKSRKQKIISFSVGGGLLLVIVFAGFIFRSLRVTRKQKQIIEVQKTEVEKSKHIIEEKNKDITDSINYAKRIQQAKLPKYEEIKSTFPESFVLFKPKDIVSGDFYFYSPLERGKGCVIAAADCTGHGVPGAFMSMIGSEKLDDALAHSADTSEILAHLNKGIKNSLHQSDSDESTRDGMDIALVRITNLNEFTKVQNDTNNSNDSEFRRLEKDSLSVQLHYAGANRPLWIIRKTPISSPNGGGQEGAVGLEEIKATKKAIGGFTEDNQHFDTHIVQLQRGDTFYIFSDGYADTFSKQDKKLTTKKFKEILLSIQHKSLSEQGQHLDNFIEDWKGGAEQVDDILVIGIRL